MSLSSALWGDSKVCLLEGGGLFWTECCGCCFCLSFNSRSFLNPGLPPCIWLCLGARLLSSHLRERDLSQALPPPHCCPCLSARDFFEYSRSWLMGPESCQFGGPLGKVFLLIKRTTPLRPHVMSGAAAATLSFRRR